MSDTAQPPVVVQANVEADIEAVRRDYRVLDRMDMEFARGVRLISHDPFDHFEDGPVKVTCVKPGVFLRALDFVPPLRDLLLSWRMLMKADKRTAIICVGSCRFERCVGLLNYYLPIRRRKVVLCGPFVQTASPVKRWLIRRMVQGGSVSLTWSAKSVENLAEYLSLPKETFACIPYKANHSKWPPVKLRIGNYVFSGGNGRRDYTTLVEAVRGTGIPVIISATDPKVRHNLDVPSNVILLAAWEPAFRRLMAGSRFVVFPIESGTVRGGGAANILNAMWHSKPVIAAEDVQAAEYIEEGVTGYTVDPGDVDALRDRIVSLWNAGPDRLAEMGRRGHEYVARSCTHEDFLRRVVRFSALIATT